MFSNLSGVVEIQEFIDEIKDVLQWKYLIVLIKSGVSLI
jgi:hypothetical protein